MKRLAIIPARGGSKRIPQKNVKDFCGKPMVSHVISAAADSKTFDKVHISTDDDTIANVAKAAGYEVEFRRPEHLSDDHTSMIEVIKFVIEEYKKRGELFDTVCLLYATSPLMAANDISSACEIFESGNTSRPLLAVSPYPAPIEHAFRMDNKTFNITPDDPEALSKRTQDLDHAYYDAGMFAFYSSSYLLNADMKNLFMSFRGYEVPSFRVTDIDWPEDWERAEILYKSLRGL